jgi:hypothetical protein
VSRFLIWYVVRVLVLRRLTQIVTTGIGSSRESADWNDEEGEKRQEETAAVCRLDRVYVRRGRHPG